MKPTPYLTPLEQKALKILRDLYQQHTQNLVAGGREGSQARVTVQDWAVALKQHSIPLETMTALKTTRQVRLDDPYVILAEA